jgi:NADPH-dependent 2,4-dienoyl-CoA reductase/sulfur reductase-like enzyme
MKQSKSNYKKKYDLVIIGGGPAGMAAGVRAHELGIRNILLIERDKYLGGILPQCIHAGFGIKIFSRDLTGPEYSTMFEEKIILSGIDIMVDTMALNIKREDGLNIITVANRGSGYSGIEAKSVILALGCRERTRGQINIPGSRPSGVYTAGVIQRMVNIEGYMPGKNVVVLGSGDIGLIMARRMHLEGCMVKGVFEINPFSTGLLRNIAQCLDDFNIPLYFSHTVTDIIGNKRIEAVQVSKVDENLKPVKGSGRIIECDTLLLSVGLIPENELSLTCGIELDNKTLGPIVDENYQTTTKGIFSCGNSLFVNDIVDNVTEAGQAAAQGCFAYLNEEPHEESAIEVQAGEGILYAVPQKISGLNDVTFNIRVKRPMKNTYIVFNDFFKKKFKFLAPGEMVFIKINKDILKGMAESKTRLLKIYTESK